MGLTKTAWRNIWRNRRRTVLSATAVFAATLVVCLVTGFESGFIDDMQTNVACNLTGDVRVMDRRYIENERVSPLQFFIENTAGALRVIGSSPLVGLATPKTDFGVSIYRAGNQIPSRAIGLDFATSRMINRKTTRVVSGRLPAPGRNEAMVTGALAKELGLSPGDRFTALARTATNGSNGRTFTVCGILALADSDFRNRVVFMDWKLAGEFLRMRENALGIQVFLMERARGDEAALAASVRASLAKAGMDADGLDIRPWYEASGLYSFFRMGEMLYLIIGVIFFFLAGTVIFNTTMMSVLERKKEIGTLEALGMEKPRILALFLLESVWIAALGTLSGGIAGFAAVGVMGRIGFDFSALGGDSIRGMSASQVIYPALAPWRGFAIMAMGILVSALACYIPARMSTRVEPAEALREK